MKKEKVKLIIIMLKCKKIRIEEQVLDDPISFACHTKLMEELKKWRKKVFDVDQKETNLIKKTKTSFKKIKHSFIYL